MSVNLNITSATKTLLKRALYFALIVLTSASASATVSNHVGGCTELLHSNLVVTGAPWAPENVLEIVSEKVEINVASDLTAVVNSVRKRSLPNAHYAQTHPEKAYVEIVKIGGLKHSYIAVFNHYTYMNWALGRISTFQTQGRIISDKNLIRKDSPVQSFGGHDISADVIRDFSRAFLEARRQSGPQEIVDPAFDSPKLHVELEFWQNVVVPLVENDPSAVLIAVGLNYRPGKVLSHEILHAFFYETPELQKKVAQFWNEEVSVNDRRQYLEVLNREKYDLSNHKQVINEFLAYTLEGGPAVIFPPALIKRYRARLREYLKSAGLDVPALASELTR